MNFKTTPAFSFSLSKKLEIEKDDKLITPGPERYNPKKIIIRDGTINIGLSKRTNKKLEETPGPGTYNVPSKFPKGLKYSMGVKTSSESNKEEMYKPGPGTYKIMNKSQSSFYSFGLKLKDKKIDDTPGPGNYNIRRKQDLYIPSYIFGKEKRIFSSLSSFDKMPGPGNYKYNEDAIRINSPHFSFGKEERKSINIKKDDIPGPGTYRHKEYIGKEGLKISLSPRCEIKNNKLNSLGPGQYNRTDLNFYKPKTPSTKFGKLKRFSLSSHDIFDNGIPGPGKYNYINSINVTKKSDPKWKIGTGKRRGLVETDKYIPGPGIYNVTKKIGKDSPFYSMGMKEKEKTIKFNSPGPGKYNLNKLITFMHSPTWKIGTGKKILDLNIDTDIPGPGTYTVRSKKTSGPRFGFGREKRGFLTFNNLPGPGTYHIPCSIELLNTYTRRKGKFNEEFRYI